MQGLSSLTKLTILDVSSNLITRLEGLEGLTCLEDLWLNDNGVSVGCLVASGGRINALTVDFHAARCAFVAQDPTPGLAMRMSAPCPPHLPRSHPRPGR